MGDAEALLLINDQQAQVMELHALLQQLVGPDEQIDAAPLGRVQNPLLLLGGGIAGEDLDFDGEVPEPAAGGGIVLLRQHRGGHQNGGLLAVQHALHHRPEGHLRLAVAHVAAQQAVHGPGLFHVLLDLPDGPELIVRLRIGEGLLKFQLPGRVRRKGKAGTALPLGIQGCQPLGQVLGGLFGPGFLLGPLGTAQLVELLALLVLTAANIFGHQIQRRSRDVQAVSAGVVDLHVVFFHPVHRHPLDSGKPAHAMVGMHHQIAGREVRIGLELLPVGLFFPLGLTTHRGRQLSLRQHRQLQNRPLAPGGEGSHTDADLSRPGHGGILGVQGGGNPPLLQHPLQVVAPAFTAAEHHHRAAALPVLFQVCHGGLQAAAVRTQLPGIHAQKSPGPHGMPGRGQGVRHDDGKFLQRCIQLLRRKRHPGKLPAHDPRLQQRLQVLVELDGRRLGPLLHPAALAEKDHCILRQIVHTGHRIGINSRKVAVHTAGQSAAQQQFRILPQPGGGFCTGSAGFFQLFHQGGQPPSQSVQSFGRTPGQHLGRRQQQS